MDEQYFDHVELKRQLRKYTPAMWALLRDNPDYLRQYIFSFIKTKQV